MCGRFTLGVTTEQLVAEFGPLHDTSSHRPRYNIAPTQPVLAVVSDGEGLRLGELRWGLVPHWARDPRIGSRMINARSETADRKPAFRHAFHRRRCWVLADGFYEWRKEPDGTRRPFHIRHPDGRPFAFAGLWERWRGGDGDDLVTCTILTRDPVAPISDIHDRMPVILPRGNRERWLDPAAPAGALRDLFDWECESLEVVPVSTRVNSTANDDPGLRAPNISPPLV